MEREEYTRVDLIRRRLDDQILEIEDLEARRCCYVHYYGVGMAAAMIALKRGHDRRYAELAQIAGMLHDYTKAQDFVKCQKWVEDDHAHRCEPLAREILMDMKAFSEDEIQLICHAIYCHSDKDKIDGEMDEIIKDADVLQKWLRNPMEQHFFKKPRVNKLMEEFGMKNC